MLLWVYRFSYACVFAVFACLSLFSRKGRQGFLGRHGLTTRIRELSRSWNERPYWFHFASSGEFEQAIPILEALKEREPQSLVLLTYFSPTGKRAVELEEERRRAAGASIPWDGSDYSPWDFPWTVRSFIDPLCPRALIVMNREFWPELFEACWNRQIPLYLFAAFLSEKAKRFFKFYRPWLERAAFLGTVDGSSAAFLKTLLPRQAIQSIGDPRIERVLSRRKLARQELFQSPLERVFVGASLWPEDFRALLPSLQKLLDADPEWTIFLVPHEVHGNLVTQMESWAAGQGVEYVRWSQARTGYLPPVIIVDNVGWLAELYRAASLAFVGGSFRSRVHNVLEPAAYGVPMLTGPHIRNSVEAQQLAQAGGLVVTHSADDLCQKTDWFLNQENARKQSGAQALQFLEERTGAGSRYTEVLLR